MNTTDKETGEITEFFFINEEIRFPLTPVQEYDFSVDRSKLEYQEKSFKIIFVLPKSIIQEKVDTIFWNLANFIQISIIIPFTVTTLIMMLFGGYFLNKIAQGVTSPIVELQEKIGDIIKFRNEEKKGLKQTGGQEYDIMNNYVPRNNEINQLHLAFSKLSKTVRAARNSLM